MTGDDARVMSLWCDSGLRTEGIGPQAEWDPVNGSIFQLRHDAFWRSLSGIIPDDEADEPYWMTQAASTKLLHNPN